jgi:hypothetical protein
MKWIVSLVLRDFINRDLNELLDSWALIFAIVPFGALIFCGMYVGQFILDSTVLGVVLMFVFPLAAFALLYYARQSAAARKGSPQPAATPAGMRGNPDLQTLMVVVCIAGAIEDGQEPMYTLRRANALENMYVQQGYAPTVEQLKEQVGDKYRNVDWTHVVEEPPRNLTASLQRSDARSAPVRSSR